MIGETEQIAGADHVAHRVDFPLVYQTARGGASRKGLRDDGTATVHGETLILTHVSVSLAGRNGAVSRRNRM